MLEIPTGLGKTAAILLAWLHKRQRQDAHTPRRLVWCLPMRVLVEQAARLARQWTTALAGAGLLSRAPAVHVLMGGDVARDWDLRPEDDAILIGTQDQLLSRALNRGYAMSRFRWPLDFALLHNDAFWVFDEVQLMGAGLPTSTQLEAFRQRFGSALPCRSLWCSATLHPRWLASVDFAARCPAPQLRTLDAADMAFPQVVRRIHAAKRLQPLVIKKIKDLAVSVLKEHRPGTLTLVIRNRVKEAVDLFATLKKDKKAPPLCLLHSRFRPVDRGRVLEEALSAPGEAGCIIITTQVVEAGVDISAATLFTDLAPWSSLVQRFGRCNRAGELEDAASSGWTSPAGRNRRPARTRRRLWPRPARCSPGWRMPRPPCCPAAKTGTMPTPCCAPLTSSIFSTPRPILPGRTSTFPASSGKVTIPTCRPSGVLGRETSPAGTCPARRARSCAPCR